MEFLATYEYEYWYDGECLGQQFITASSLKLLREEIAKTKFRLEFGCEEPSQWNGRKTGDKTRKWTIYKLALLDFPAMLEDMDSDDRYEKVDAWVEFATLAEKATQFFNETTRREEAKKRAYAEQQELALLKHLKEKYENG